MGLETVLPGDDYYWDYTKRASHRRRYSIVQYTRSGAGCISHAGRVYSVAAGSAFVCNSHAEDTAYFYPADAREPWELLYVELSNSEAVVEELLSRFGPVYVVPSGALWLHEVQRWLGRREKVDRVTVAWSVHLASMIISELVNAGVTDEAGQYSPLVRRGCEMIQERVGDVVRVGDIAKALGVTREHFGRVFRRDMQMTVVDYVNRLKILGACELLGDPAISIAEVGSRFGFDNPSHFARVFRRVAGVSATDYRRTGGPPSF